MHLHLIGVWRHLQIYFLVGKMYFNSNVTEQYFQEPNKYPVLLWTRTCTPSVPSHYLNQWWPNVLTKTCITWPLCLVVAKCLFHIWVWKKSMHILSPPNCALMPRVYRYFMRIVMLVNIMRTYFRFLFSLKNPAYHNYVISKLACNWL